MTIPTEQPTRQQYVADEMDRIGLDFGGLMTKWSLCREASIMLRSAERRENELTEQAGLAVAELTRLREENKRLRDERVEVRRILQLHPESESSTVERVQWLDASHGEICGKLQECTHRHHLGLGGEQTVDLVVAEVDRLRREQEG